MKYAGFWRRCAAISIDTVLFLFIFILLEIAIPNNFFIISFIYECLCALYFIVLTASKYQATLGQMILKIKIADIHESRLSITASIVRYIFWALPAWPLIIYSSLPSVGKVLDNSALCDTITEQETYDTCFEASGMLEIAIPFAVVTAIAIIGGFVWSLSIAFHKEKAGIHDRICKQRAFVKEKGTQE